LERRGVELRLCCRGRGLLVGRGELEPHEYRLAVACGALEEDVRAFLERSQPLREVFTRDPGEAGVVGQGELLVFAAGGDDEGLLRRGEFLDGAAADGVLGERQADGREEDADGADEPVHGEPPYRSGRESNAHHAPGGCGTQRGAVPDWLWEC